MFFTFTKFLMNINTINTVYRQDYIILIYFKNKRETMQGIILIQNKYIGQK